MNLTHWDKIKKNPVIIQLALIFLDCICTLFLEQAKDISGLEKASRFTEKARAVGLGTLGLHSLFIQKGILYDSIEAITLNNEIYSTLRKEAENASRYLAEHLGECEWSKGTGLRNCSLLAIAPNKSSALLAGGVSEGISPYFGNTFTQTTPAGEIDRVVPEFLNYLKSKDLHTKEHLQEIIDAKGSCQKVDWLSDDEKALFRTAFEYDQKVILRLASNRQKYIDQMQSINLFFTGEENEYEVDEAHVQALLDPNIHSLYYIYSRREKVDVNKECRSCQ